MTHRQAKIVRFVRDNPGCSIADVCRWEWGSLGHAATYARVNRMIRRGYLRAEKGAGKSVALHVVMK